MLRITCRVYRIKGLENTRRIRNLRVTDTTARVPLALLQFHIFTLVEVYTRLGVISLVLSPLFPTNTDGKTEKYGRTAVSPLLWQLIPQLSHNWERLTPSSFMGIGVPT